MTRGERDGSRPDICRDFQLHGIIRPLTSSPTIFGQFLDQRGSGQPIRVPFRWITNVVVVNPGSKTASLLPMPTWIERETLEPSLKRRSRIEDRFQAEVSREYSKKKTKVPAAQKTSLRPNAQVQSEDFLPRHKWTQPDMAGKVPQNQSFVPVKLTPTFQASNQLTSGYFLSKQKRTPEQAICFKCGTPLKSCMLVWSAEKRFCKSCRRLRPETIPNPR